jgi:hypothetical protein
LEKLENFLDMCNRIKMMQTAIDQRNDMKTLLLVTPDPLDGCSWYRSTLPFSVLAAEMGFNLLIRPKPSWADIAACDAAFLQRPASVEAMRVAVNASSCGKKLWIDYDDLLAEVPRTNEGHDYYQEPQTKVLLTEFCTLADETTVSTLALKDLMCPRADILPNAVPDFLWGKWKPKRNKIIAWRGGSSHIADLEIIRADVETFLTSNPEWSFAFLGHAPWWADKLPSNQIIRAPFRDCLSYHVDLFNLAPTAMWVPLEPGEFNTAKSNCAWLEASAAGAVVIASNLPEFNQPGVTLMGENDCWLTETKQLFCHFKRTIEESRAPVVDSYLLSKVNKKRAAILRRVLMLG